MANDLEGSVVEQMGDVFSATGEEIVDTCNLVTFTKQPLAQKRSQKTRAPSYQDSFYLLHLGISKSI
jgi:hypothetical protein